MTAVCQESLVFLIFNKVLLTPYSCHKSLDSSEGNLFLTLKISVKTIKIKYT